jgi:sulfur-carrier protein
VTVSSTASAVTVRFFAAAEDAAGTTEQVVDIRPGSTIANLIDDLGAGGGPLFDVLRRCSYLCDGIAVRDTAATLRSGQTIDVLPPFAGG